MQHVAGKTQQVGEGVLRWRMRMRDREAVNSLSLMPHGVKVLLWVVVSLLPLVGGAGTPGRADAGPGRDRSLGMRGSQAERESPITLPALVEEEEQEEHPYPTWHALYDPYVIEEEASPRGRRSAGRFPRFSETSESPPGGNPRKKKRRKKEKEGETEKGGRRERGERGRGRGQAGHAPRQSSKDCYVEKREMKVRDLGLGFDSDEIIVFKFCVGSCQASRTNYDLALKALLRNGSLPRHTARRVAAAPCCRPDRYDPISFMDAQTTWRTIQSLSAASCMCMG